MSEKVIKNLFAKDRILTKQTKQISKLQASVTSNQETHTAQMNKIQTQMNRMAAMLEKISDPDTSSPKRKQVKKFTSLEEEDNDNNHMEDDTHQE